MHLPNVPWKPRWFVDDTVLKREGSRSQGRKLTYQALELGSNNLSVTLVASLGFFTGSYVLFCSSLVLPMLGFIYWHDATKSSHETAFNNATTSGCIVGMVFFGLFADWFGRRKMYGFEIIVLMVGTMGVVMSSTGYAPLDQTDGRTLGSIDYGSFGSMNIQSWLLFWRFVSGIGIGGEYPLTAVIASEFSPSSMRPRILATVFAMQPIGIAAGAIVSIIVTKAVQSHHPYDSSHPEASARAVDQIWRWVVGSSLIPALVTAILRFTIPESPRYTLDVRNDPVKAFEEADRLKGLALDSDIIQRSNGAVISHNPLPNDVGDFRNPSISSIRDVGKTSQNPTIKQYFLTEGYWRYLLATSLSWFLVDFATFSLSVNSSQMLSKFWYGPTVTVKHPRVWDSNTTDPAASIFSILVANSVHLLAIESIAFSTGSILLILFITRLNRKILNWVMYLVTGTLVVITGVTLLVTTGKPSWGINIGLYALCKFSEALGIGPFTFLIPAELFHTRFRASCHGISAAAGKLGSVLAAIFLRYVTFGHITASSSPTDWLSYVMIVFSVPLFLGAGICWLWIPDLQDTSGKSKTLEQLADCRRSSRSNGVVESAAS